ncbi:Uncharacterised protein [Metamycoplasma cloacale]|uniref:Uncharacterized protein n=1 Tax=Metamycoplasma cloacale TaxID=92401 RepID=A0A2Z4LLF1_9BACT|nr:hypothetical protein [Metamycoplasma cloacale]AWX42591.1 hypothetical protein DK849_00630 [Metamycoplasma cloacale]VEU79682.1 Uncharacterised protein [Metamycoplasma cloacale]
MKERLSFREYWRNSWNKFSLIYLFVSLIVYTSLIFIIRYVANKSYVDSITIVAILMISINLVILFIRLGFGKGLSKTFGDAIKHHKINKSVKKELSNNKDNKSYDEIYVETKRKYELEESMKNKKKLYQPKMTNLVFLTYIALGVIMIISLIPSFIK